MDSFSSEQVSVLSAFLKRKIKEKGWSVKEFAKRAGLSEKYTYRLVSSNRDFIPSDKTVDKIIDALDPNDDDGRYLVGLVIVEREAGKPLFPGHPDLPDPPGSDPEEPIFKDINVRLSEKSYKKLKSYADKEGSSLEDAAQRAIDGFLDSLSSPGPGDGELEERVGEVEENYRALKALVIGMSGKLQETIERVELIMGAIGLNLPDYS